MNFAKFLEPPQKNVSSTSWSATRAPTRFSHARCGARVKVIGRFTGFRIALVSQFAVTVNGLVAAPLQFIADRSLAGARKALDQIVSDAHCWRIPTDLGTASLRLTGAPGRTPAPSSNAAFWTGISRSGDGHPAAEG